jgi:Lon protease-like protein
MALSGVTLFPNALLPLFIHEPHYRLMLEEALGTERMFALAMPSSEAGDVESIAGAGLVRACIHNADGTSHLILQGLSRVRITGWKKKSPYGIALIEPLESLGAHHEESAELAAQVLRLHALCARFQEQGMELPMQFETYLNQITNIGIMTDLVASTLVTDPRVRQELLEELEISKRLTKLITGLSVQLA